MSSVCLAGETAQGLVGFKDYDITTAIEEALVLSTLLGRARSSSAVPAALAAFDSVWRPQAEREAATVNQMEMLAFGLVPEVGLNVDLIMERFVINLEDFTTDVDVPNMCQTAIRLMDQTLASPLEG